MESRLKLRSVVLDSGDFLKLAEFYVKLLGWEMRYCDEHYAEVGAEDGTISFFFQNAEGYIPPIWPEKPGKQQQMLHLDYVTADVKQAVEHALRCGAKKAPDTFMKNAQVMLDPAGHPFCICPIE